MNHLSTASEKMSKCLGLARKESYKHDNHFERATIFYEEVIVLRESWYSLTLLVSITSWKITNYKLT